MKDLIMYRCLSYIHGVIENKKPKCIYQIYRQNRFQQHKSELTCVNLPKGKKYSNFFLYSQNQNYNKTSGRGRLWGPALGVVKTLHTDNKQRKENMKT